MIQIHNAIEAWIDCLGMEYVIVDRPILAAAATATFATQQKIPAILRPYDRQQIQQCLEIANKYRIPVYPVSSGKNWGYGSSVPVTDGCVLLDLSRLNRILEFNAELAYVTVEAGVTQTQLYEFLQQQNTRLWMDATGSSPDTTIIGNVMERGFGHTPAGDRFANVCGLEVILPTGECIHTGFGRFPNAQTKPLYRWGIGAVLDGLFTQSNFGIVTQMTFWLIPTPEYFQAFYFSLADDAQLPPFIDALRPLRLNGTIRSAVHIGNSYKVLSSIRQYPWAESSEKTPLPPEVMEFFRKTWDFGAWSGSGGLYGTKKQVAEARRLIKQALKGKVKKLQFIDDRTLALAAKVAKPYQWITGTNLTEMLKLIRPVYGLMKGIPTATQLASTYWRKKIDVPADPNPDRDSCGLMWCAPVLPLDGQHAEIAHRLIRDTIYQHGFEPLISMTLLTERCIGCVVSIAFDRSIEGEDKKAMDCCHELYEKLTAAGYYPYRLGIQSMDILDRGEISYRELLQKLKETIDPNNILAPKRYTTTDD
jgi:4-cresol dehydrogenase (hydroxylating) flavoprotein subunit